MFDSLDVAILRSMLIKPSTLQLFASDRYPKDVCTIIVHTLVCLCGFCMLHHVNFYVIFLHLQYVTVFKLLV